MVNPWDKETRYKENIARARRALIARRMYDRSGIISSTDYSIDALGGSYLYTGTDSSLTHTVPPVFLARFDQADGSTPVNEIGSVSSNGGAASITSNKLVCNENWRTWAGSSTFDITDDWTLELHYTGHNSDGNSGMIARGTGTDKWFIYAPVDGSFEWHVGGGLILDVATLNILDGDHYLAVVKDSAAGRWTAYLDGVVIASAVSSAKGTTSTDTFYIGTDPFNVSTRAIKCSYDRVKITKACLYPYNGGASFTPPAASDS